MVSVENSYTECLNCREGFFKVFLPYYSGVHNDNKSNNIINLSSWFNKISETTSENAVPFDVNCSAQNSQYRPTNNPQSSIPAQDDR